MTPQNIMDLAKVIGLFVFAFMVFFGLNKITRYLSSLFEKTFKLLKNRGKRK